MIQNIILLITGLIGFLTAGLILKNHKLNSAMNTYIILIIVTISIRFFLSGLTPFIIDDSFTSHYLRYSNLYLVIIPLFYLYIKNLSKKTKKFNKKELLHFIFPISFIILINNLHLYKIVYKGISYVLYLIFFIYLGLYTFMCFKVLQQTIWIKKENIKLVNKQRFINSKWTIFLFIAMLLLVARLIGSIFFELKSKSIVNGFDFLWISALIWLIILFKIIVSPEILYGYDVLLKKIDKHRNGNLVLKSIWNVNSKIQINNAQHLQLKEKIEPNILTYIEEIEKVSMTDKIFRDPTITMVEIANELNTPKSHISYLFKYHSTISFSNYKKTIRIYDAIELINEDYLKENTLDYLSKKVGFPSYNTFFTSFKEITGTTPFEYCKTDKREI
jgi:AraC-like DNA-binding protein